MSFFNDSDELFHLNGNIRQEVISEATMKALNRAISHTESTRWESVRTPHLFMGLLAAPDPAIVEWGNRLGANLGRLLDQFREIFQTADAAEVSPRVRLNREFLSDNVIRLLADSLQRSRSQGRFRISPMDVLIELFGARSSIVAECFRRIGITAEQLTELALIAERESQID